jgi:hypothetical protein
MVFEKLTLNFVKEAISLVVWSSLSVNEIKLKPLVGLIISPNISIQVEYRMNISPGKLCVEIFFIIFQIYWQLQKYRPISNQS